MKRKRTRVIKIGNIFIGGNNPVAIQSMTKTATSDIEATLKQLKALKEAGCEIARLAINDEKSVRAIKEIKEQTGLALVADIHFDWRLACLVIENGIDKIRLNPGNIYKMEELKEIVKCARYARIPIRVGVNSGSVRLKNKSKSLADNMVRAALDYIKTIEKLGFHNLVISLKAADILDTIQAYRKISLLCDYPLHLGLTATGLPAQGVVKSSIALGILLSEGIGDTIRVSLTDRPEEEVKIAKSILEALGLRKFGPEIISCPTCGRCRVDLTSIVKELGNKLSTVSYQRADRAGRVAVMGCSVNGPGEARHADIGIAFEKFGRGVLFKKGRPLYRVSASDCIDALLNQMRK
ncbi:MAG: flavodoxin-dependent (E)-4-hydroxy-3-methylbut-2-enyl-diphosphate synthase [Candidatus Omnitrophica bacterium]|nr:flavodoxin-dependent (E)-4-hydroxy-3-methylbut-2-enyl-diphosphate synthase [Candidatus Omnitrophota bacterium]